MSCCCEHALLPVVGDTVKAGGRHNVRHVAHDSEGVGHSLQSIVATRLRHFVNWFAYSALHHARNMH
jgi:hypothetical protein